MLPTLLFKPMPNYFKFLFVLSPIFLNAQHQIQVDLQGNKNLNTFYLKQLKNYDWVVTDSIKQNNNKVIFNIPETNNLIYIYCKETPNFNIKLYNIKGETTISYQLSNNTYIIKGAEINEGLAIYENYMQPLNTKLAQLIENKPQIKNPSHLTFEERNAYTNHHNLIKAVNKEIDIETFNFIINNSQNKYSAILIDEKLKHVFEEKDYQNWEKLYAVLNNNQKNSAEGKKLNHFLKEYEEVKIGAIIADFELPNTKNKPKTLYKNLGKYTIIDFWASWCAPCNEEYPVMVKLHKKYKSKGLKIVGVSLDNNKEQWIKTIEKEQLKWVHLSNLIGWNEPLVKKFKLTGIPYTFILNEKGEIVAKGLKSTDLETKIDELFSEL